MRPPLTAARGTAPLSNARSPRAALAQCAWGYPGVFGVLSHGGAERPKRGPQELTEGGETTEPSGSSPLSAAPAGVTLARRWDQRRDALNRNFQPYLWTVHID